MFWRSLTLCCRRTVRPPIQKWIDQEPRIQRTEWRSSEKRSQVGGWKTINEIVNKSRKSANLKINKKEYRATTLLQHTWAPCADRKYTNINTQRCAVPLWAVSSELIRKYYYQAGECDWLCEKRRLFGCVVWVRASERGAQSGLQLCKIHKQLYTINDRYGARGCSAPSFLSPLFTDVAHYSAPAPAVRDPQADPLNLR